MCLREHGFQTHRMHWLSLALNDELLNGGTVMHIHDGNITIETSDSSSEDVHHVLDVTFVDDDCIMLASDESRSLAAAIVCCTLVLSTTFQLLKLQVNWRPGKTERLFQMIGKHGRVIVEKWRCDDGSLSIPVPQFDMRINVGDRYRKEAYGPLALRIFWVWTHSCNTETVIVHVPGRVAQFLFDAHCTTVIQRPSDLVLRDEHALINLEVRRTLKVPSYDCTSMRGRPRYVGRIVRTRPMTLMAMLSIRTGGATSPSRVGCESAGGLTLCVENRGSTDECATTRPGRSLLGWRDEGQGTMGPESAICAFLRVGTG